MTAPSLSRRLSAMVADMQRPLAHDCGLPKEFLRGSRGESERCAAQLERQRERLLDEVEHV